MSRFHCLTRWLTLIAILAGTGSYAAASPSSGAAGALGAAAAKSVGDKYINQHCDTKPVTKVVNGHTVTIEYTCAFPQ